MKHLPFLNRTGELKALRKVMSDSEPQLAVVYGRRRCGKSRLLQQLNADGIVYYLADQSDRTLQLKMLASQISGFLPGFDSGEYSSWEALLTALNGRNPLVRNKPLTLVLDEFPYLVTEYPALPSLLQKLIDTRALRTHLILSGSSQRMMKGLVFQESAPLYGRAREIIKIRPLKAGWITDALGVNDAEAIMSYAVWGGVPRYWELASEYGSHIEAIQELVLNRDAILHNEPRRLLTDDMRTDTQPHSLLAVIGSGVHRISEISARLQKPAMNLLRPLETLIDLGLVRRDIPFSELEKNTKRTLYVIADPFLRFWYTFVHPNLSALEQEIYGPVLTQWQNGKSQYLGGIWEDLARESVPHMTINGMRWKEARRYWGKNTAGIMTEIDIVAESIDGSAILLGEAKWGKTDVAHQLEKLLAAAPGLSFTKGKKVVTACWVGAESRLREQETCITPAKVLDVLR